jgi:GntR family transcriptional regulator
MAKWKDERVLYLRIAADLRARIMSGDLAGQLPSVAVLLNHYKAKSTSVIQRVIETLGTEGLVDSQHGRGNFVRGERVALIEATSYIDPKTSGTRYDLLKVADAIQPPGGLPDYEKTPGLEVVPADAVAALLLASSETAVLRKQMRVRRSDDGPIELIWNYYRPDLAQDTALAADAKIPGGAKALLATWGHEESAMDDVVTTRPPTTEEVELLELPIDVSVLRTLRTIFDQDEVPIEVSVIIKGGHLYAHKQRTELH